MAITIGLAWCESSNSVEGSMSSDAVDNFFVRGGLKGFGVGIGEGVEGGIVAVVAGE